MKRAYVRRFCLGAAVTALLGCSDSSAPLAADSPAPTATELPPAGVPFNITTANGTPRDAVAGTVGERVATPFVLVQDRFGTPVAGVRVTFVAGANGGVIEGGDQLTRTDGVARPVSWTLGPAMERYVVLVTSGRATLAISRIPATGVAARVVPFMGDAQIVYPGQAVRQRPFVRVTDDAGRDIPYAVIDWRDAAEKVICQNLVLRGVAEFNCEWIPGNAPGVYTLAAVVGAARGLITATVIARPSASRELEEP